MNKGSNIRQFGDLLNNLSKGHVKVQTCWAKVKSIDWDKRTMVVTGVTDDLEYYDTSLGLGSYYRKPVVGSLCLIGLINNQDAASFLIDAEQIEEGVFLSDDTSLIFRKDGFVIKSGGESFKAVLNDLHEQIGKLADEVSKIVVSIGTGPNVPQITMVKNEITNTIKGRLNKILIE
ncbi:hypothetical protein GFS24_10245 [Chitinophaga sp. SYP-B3965]|uniref:hypothetical protein n=1 Tax=Chitinophaga sp. SYP-B3965 TaxID=2663120 RepID=UPI0012998516|nr:hypothetical protein [Chitinophaga sp. SYP-B3965]MRG45497.1 hypothetical protein [Chitinophaga sp. SYP-B3965]